jgi:hypothetical protein
VSSLQGGRSAPAECRCPDSKICVRNKINTVFGSVLDFNLILSDVGTSKLYDTYIILLRVC